jgi:Protein of unknown function (DUF2628)
MASYIVMTDPDDRNGENVRFVRDGFSLIAFLLPLVWLLWKRLWLEAALLFAALGIIGYGIYLVLGDRASQLMPFLSAALGLMCAFEGPTRLIAGLERKGMKASQIIVASSRRVAEEIFASRYEFAARPQISSGRIFQPVSNRSLIPLTGAV